MAAQIDTAFDRCDDDQAERPYVWLHNPRTGRTLAFCAHHFKQYGPTLIGRGWLVAEDLREELEPKKVLEPVE